MPESWMEEQALQQRKQVGSWDSGVAGGQTTAGRVLRAGTRPADANASYWDVVVLGVGNKDLNFNPLSSGRPVRPYVADVSSSVGHSAGDIISFKLGGGLKRTNAVTETGSGTEDYCEVSPGQHSVVGGGGSTCAMSINSFGLTGLL